MPYSSEGGLRVPPNPICPTVQEGTVTDLRTATFMLGVDHELDVDGEFVQGWVFGIFTEEDDTGANASMVSSDGVVVSSPEWVKIAGEMDESDPAATEDVRRGLCDRVEVCRGVIEGRCWALSPEGVRTVLERVAREHGYELPPANEPAS